MSVKQWAGNIDLDDKSGIATILVKGVECQIRLECFADYWSISQAFDAAYENGREQAAKELNREIGHIFRDKFGVTSNALDQAPQPREEMR